MNTDARMMTTRELADYIGVSVGTIKRLRAEGLIRGYRIRTQLRFILSEVLEDIARGEKELPLRRLAGKLIKSDPPPKDHLRGRLLASTIDLDDTEEPIHEEEDTCIDDHIKNTSRCKRKN